MNGPVNTLGWSCANLVIGFDDAYSTAASAAFQAAAVQVNNLLTHLLTHSITAIPSRGGEETN